MSRFEILKENFDKKVKSKVYIISIPVGEYLSRVESSTEGELEIQRTFLGFRVYKRLIADILQGALIPPISVISNEFGADEENSPFLVLDGLQRTYCFKIALDILSKKEESTYYRTIKDSIPDFENPAFKNEDDFKKNYKILVEIWTNMDITKTLYKMVVLNTGQKKMSLQHQLDILALELKKELEKELNILSSTNILTEKDIKSQKIKSSDLEKKGYIKLYALTEGLVSYLKGSPVKNKQDAVEYLFERLESFENLLSPTVKEDIKFLLKNLHPNFKIKFQEKEIYILSRYEPILIGLLASIGRLRKENKLKEESLKALSKESINWNKFIEYYERFKSGIGSKRRKFAFEIFRGYLSGKFDNLQNEEVFEEVYSEVK